MTHRAGEQSLGARILGRLQALGLALDARGQALVYGGALAHRMTQLLLRAGELEWAASHADDVARAGFAPFGSPLARVWRALLALTHVPPASLPRAQNRHPAPQSRGTCRSWCSRAPAPRSRRAGPAPR